MFVRGFGGRLDTWGREGEEKGIFFLFFLFVGKLVGEVFDRGLITVIILSYGSRVMSGHGIVSGEVTRSGILE